MAALAGANQIYGAGMIESGVTFDFGQFVMDNEFARMIKHVRRRHPVDDETLAVDDIAQVGAFGDFLSLDATLRHMRELSQPEFLDRRVREDWEAARLHGPLRACLEKAREVIESISRSRSDDDRQAGIHAIVEEPPPAASPERGADMKDQLKQSHSSPATRDTVERPDRGAARHRRAGPRDPRRRRSCPAWRSSAQRMREGECFIPEVLL